MKDNLNIEELFQQKFENFQADVSPDVWANVQAGITAGTAATTGITAALKIGLISGGIIAASVATWYFGFYEPEQTIVPANIEIANNQSAVENSTTGETIIHVNDQNDPVILENKEKIENELQRNDQPLVNNSQTTTVTTNPNGSDGSVFSANTNGSTNNTNSSTTVNSNENVVVEPPHDPIARPDAPTGRMEYSPSNVYAPTIIAFTSNAKNQKEVRWDFGDGTSAEGTDAKHTYTKPGKYTVEMTIIGDGSAYSETQEIVVKSKSSVDNIPNVITPNGDRINDLFSVSTTDIENFSISIRDRNGNEIFSSNDKAFVWDGTDYSGNTVEKGIYTYIIIAEGIDGSVIKLPGQIYVQ